jgi:hypothetical protein
MNRIDTCRTTQAQNCRHSLQTGVCDDAEAKIPQQLILPPAGLPAIQPVIKRKNSPPVDVPQGGR